MAEHLITDKWTVLAISIKARPKNKLPFAAGNCTVPTHKIEQEHEGKSVVLVAIRPSYFSRHDGICVALKVLCCVADVA